MLTKHEARKLQREFQRELNATKGALLFCVALLLMLLALVWIGNENIPDTIWTPGSRQVLFGVPTSKDVFDDRRQRFIEAYPNSVVARENAFQKEAEAYADGGYAYYAK